MWVKLGNEYLNLDHIARVRFTTGWKNGQEEIVAEVEVVVGGVMQALSRYRGREAQILQAALGSCSTGEAGKPVTGEGPGRQQPQVAATTHRDTLHDI